MPQELVMASGGTGPAGAPSPLANGEGWGRPCWRAAAQGDLPTSAAGEGRPDLEGAVAG